jgi:hypothetical protein
MSAVVAIITNFYPDTFREAAKVGIVKLNPKSGVNYQPPILNGLGYQTKSLALLKFNA